MHVRVYVCKEWSVNCGPPGMHIASTLNYGEGGWLVGLAWFWRLKPWNLSRRRTRCNQPASGHIGKTALNVLHCFFVAQGLSSTLQSRLKSEEELEVWSHFRWKELLGQLGKFSWWGNLRAFAHLDGIVMTLPIIRGEDYHLHSIDLASIWILDRVTLLSNTYVASLLALKGRYFWPERGNFGFQAHSCSKMKICHDPGKCVAACTVGT